MDSDRGRGRGRGRGSGAPRGSHGRWHDRRGHERQAPSQYDRGSPSWSRPPRQFDREQERSPVSFQNRNNQLPPFKKEEVHKDSVHAKDPPAKTWKEFNPKEIIQLPRRNLKYDGPKNFTSETKIAVNHFLAKMNIPNPLYRYDITVEQMPKEGTKNGGSNQRKLPALLRKIIIKHVVEDLRREHANAGIITNYSDTLATVKELPDAPMTLRIMGDSLKDVKGKHLTEEIGNEFKVEVKPNLAMDTTELNAVVNDMKGKEMPGDVTDLEAIYGMLMRNLSQNYFPMKKTYLIDFSEVRPSYLTGGLVNFRGYSAMMPLNNGWKPFINIELANLAAYMDGPVLAVVQKVLDQVKDAKPPLTPGCATDMRTWNRNDGKPWMTSDWDKLNDALSSCKIKYKPDPKISLMWDKTVAALCPASVSETTFPFENLGMVSVFDFFTKYRKPRIPLKHPNGPCLELKGRNMPKVPAEICYMKAGQSFNRKLNAEQVNEMGKVARLKPTDPGKYCGGLQPAIQKSVEKLGLTNNELLKTYGVQLATGEMHQVEAKILQAPELVYGKKTGQPDNGEKAIVTPQDGVWDIWSSRFEFYRNVRDPKWAIVNLANRFPPRSGPEDRKANCMDFAKKLITKAETRGIKLPQPVAYREENLRDSMDSNDQNVNKLRQAFTAILKQVGKKDSFVLVVIPKKGCSLYKAVKQAAECHVGLLTQCIVAGNLVNPKDSVVGNILLKINSKLTYVNHVVLPPAGFEQSFTIFNYPTIIIGADVTHPPPGSGQTVLVDGKQKRIEPPSFAAVTASSCRTGMPFAMHIQAQKKAGKGAAEVIEGLHKIVHKFMWQFLDFTGQQPAKIIYFRDGVGEGQFQEVLRTELTAIRRACEGLHKGYTPSITFVTVQKRHKTRFFLPTGNNKYTNAPPGTVVDRDIVHRTEIDFYLQSHQAILGTSRPTRYHVLWDDSDFSMNEIQTMAYYLCYMFARCNRSVKIPAPTYYAHWAAKRAEVLSAGWGASYYADETMDRLNAELDKREKDFIKQYPMHFV